MTGRNLKLEESPLDSHADEARLRKFVGRSGLGSSADLRIQEKIVIQFIDQVTHSMALLGRVLINTGYLPNDRTCGEPDTPGWREPQRF